MKRFVFPLASLLNAKRLMEKEAKRSLLQAELQLQTLLDALDALTNAFSAASEERRRQALAGIGPLAMLQYDSHFLSLRDQITARHEAIRLAEQERDRCREALRLLFSEIKALESLREQQWAVYQIEVERERALDVDEFVSFNEYRALSRGGVQ